MNESEFVERRVLLSLLIVSIARLLMGRVWKSLTSGSHTKELLVLYATFTNSRKSEFVEKRL